MTLKSYQQKLMSRCLQSLDTSKELILQRRGDGYTLVRPETMPRKHAVSNQMPQAVYSLGDILDQPFDVYLYNTSHQFQIVNEVFTENCFISSPSLARGKRASEFFANSGETLEQNNEKVFMMNEKLITQEDLIFSDEIHQSYLSIKAPLYNESDNLVGIFGASVRLGIHTTADSLQKMVQIGFLQSNQPHYSANHLGDIQLTKRQSQVVSHVIRGKSAKQIAGILNLSKRTVEHYIDAIKTKLNVSTKAELISKILFRSEHK